MLYVSGLRHVEQSGGGSLHQEAFGIFFMHRGRKGIPGNIEGPGFDYLTIGGIENFDNRITLTIGQVLALDVGVGKKYCMRACIK